MAKREEPRGRESQNETYYRIAKGDLDRMLADVLDVKEYLPKVLNSELIATLPKLESKRKELEILRAENTHLKKELEHIKQNSITEMELMKKRYNNLSDDYGKGREEKFQLKCQLADVNQQLSDQSEYCAGMGAATCTLLWRVSRQQESVISLLGGTKAEEFFQISTKTIESYFATCGEEEVEEKTEEFQFVLALCGIMTNIAAAPCGRDFLVTNKSGQKLIDMLVTSIEEASVGNNIKIRSLILMALYNISIHCRGLQHLTSKPSVFKALMHLLRDEENQELRLNAARLLQSFMMEPDTLSQNAIQQVTPPALQLLASTAKGEVQTVLLDILSDLQRCDADYS